jgi:hypothetical protein
VVGNNNRNVEVPKPVDATTQSADRKICLQQVLCGHTPDSKD